MFLKMMFQKYGINNVSKNAVSIYGIKSDRLEKFKLAADLNDDVQSVVNWVGNGLLILTSPQRKALF